MFIILLKVYFESNEIWSLKFSLLFQILCFLLLYIPILVCLHLKKMMWKKRSNKIFEDMIASGCQRWYRLQKKLSIRSTSGFLFK